MSSLNHCIKFELDVKDENIVFKDYFYKSIKLQKHKIHEAEVAGHSYLDKFSRALGHINI